MSDHDELTGIFDDLTPEDFLKMGDFRDDRIGLIPFGKFIEKNIDSIRMAYVASEGQINPIAVFESPDNEWVVSPNDDENMGQYIQRLRDTAKTLKATWFFISRKTTIGSFMADPDDIMDAADPRAIEYATEAGLMTEGVLYYAERFEDGVRDARHGYMQVENGRLTEVIEGNPAQKIELFSNILS